MVDEEVTGSSCSEVVNDPSRLGSLNLNNRWCWWNEAVDVYAEHAPDGAGAGTFEIARKRVRTDVRNVLQPHSVPLQQLADGGVVALGLFVLLVLAGAGVCVAAVRRLEGAERARRGRARRRAGGVPRPRARRLHAGTSSRRGADDGRARRARRSRARHGAGRRRPFLAIAAVLVALVVLVVVRVASRSREQRSGVDPRARRPGLRRRARPADRARLLNPLSVEPIWALARVDERQGRYDDAEERYVQAVELQPENPETWYALGLYEFQVRGNMCAAYEFLNNAYTLDPAGSQWVEGGELDVARDAVNKGACEPG